MIRIGIDVGGTNTDAVIMNSTEVIAGVGVRDHGRCHERVVKRCATCSPHPEWMRRRSIS